MTQAAPLTRREMRERERALDTRQDASRVPVTTPVPAPAPVQAPVSEHTVALPILPSEPISTPSTTGPANFVPVSAAPISGATPDFDALLAGAADADPEPPARSERSERRDRDDDDPSSGRTRHGRRAAQSSEDDFSSLFGSDGKERDASGTDPFGPTAARSVADAPQAVVTTTAASQPDHSRQGAAEPRPSKRDAKRAARGEAARVAAERAQRVDGGAERRSVFRAPRSKSTTRRPVVIASAAALAFLPGLLVAAPASAAPATLSAAQLEATIASNSRILSQTLAVPSSVSTDDVQTENYVAGAVAGIVTEENGPDGPQVAMALANALQAGTARQQIIETALTYLGDPYSLGGSTHDGIDCSGLTMVAYASAGISMAHLVSSQDALATPVTEAQAQPGDLVFFDSDEHVAIYLGGGLIIEAADYGIPVHVVPLTTWGDTPYHFGRILKNS